MLSEPRPLCHSLAELPRDESISEHGEGMNIYQVVIGKGYIPSSGQTAYPGVNLVYIFSVAHAVVLSLLNHYQCLEKLNKVT